MYEYEGPRVLYKIHYRRTGDPEGTYTEVITSSKSQVETIKQLHNYYQVWISVPMWAPEPQI